MESVCISLHDSFFDMFTGGFIFCISKVYMLTTKYIGIFFFKHLWIYRPRPGELIGLAILCNLFKWKADCGAFSGCTAS